MRIELVGHSYEKGASIIAYRATQSHFRWRTPRRHTGTRRKTPTLWGTVKKPKRMNMLNVVEEGGCSASTRTSPPCVQLMYYFTTNEVLGDDERDGGGGVITTVH
ncbi:uncharacterized protein LOC130052027 [Ostrea edulis]|uniref:uncharacterized protein LOC130052027 n=1 Tax=Ostrea edulis TaxID=37623 RepID=UPI0024AFFB63|nr:uncharacterized protein LOC130052027 [Ostrea edulis]